MADRISQSDLKRIEAGIRDKYRQVAENPEGNFAYPVGRAGLAALKYDPERINALPEAVVSSYCGVGNPFSLGPIHEGDAVLDVGCGAGVDTLLAAMMAGRSGRAVGIDIVPEMLQKAEANMEKAGLQNARFIRTSGDVLPFADAEFDVVLSNGAINLIPDKTAVVREIHRVLKPGGRLMVADQVAVGGVRKEMEARLASWFQ